LSDAIVLGYPYERLLEHFRMWKRAVGGCSVDLQQQPFIFAVIALALKAGAFALFIEVGLEQ
jgi:hypothetical protein